MGAELYCYLDVLICRYGHTFLAFNWKIYLLSSLLVDHHSMPNSMITSSVKISFIKTWQFHMEFRLTEINQFTCVMPYFRPPVEILFTNFRRRVMYHHMEILKKVDFIVTPTTGYDELSCSTLDSNF